MYVPCVCVMPCVNDLSPAMKQLNRKNRVRLAGRTDPSQLALSVGGLFLSFFLSPPPPSISLSPTSGSLESSSVELDVPSHAVTAGYASRRKDEEDLC